MVSIQHPAADIHGDVLAGRPVPSKSKEQNVASELNPAEQNNPRSGESRRSFLAKLGIGAAALALVAGPLSALRGNSNGNDAMNQELD
ncbi:MAG: twin-arginine translocation signal domain-containing protein [Chloroflexi bacterium]|nr:twin-arginine translocation signal domain-containing protein [Chloroflexota bacterium]